jgi:hypothetical protein
MYPGAMAQKIVNNYYPTHGAYNLCHLRILLLKWLLTNFPLVSSSYFLHVFSFSYAHEVN